MTRLYAAIISVFRIGYGKDEVYSIVELFTDRTVADYWMHDRMEAEERRIGIRISGTIESFRSDDIEFFENEMRSIKQEREIEEARRKEATEGGDSA